MRVIAALLAAFVCCGFGHGEAPFASQVNKNLITDYGATCNGVANDLPAFNAMTAANAGANVVLTIPPGSVCCILAGSAPELAYGLANLRVIGYGASISNFCNGAGGNFYFLGTGGGFPHASGIFQDNSHTALVATTSSGVSFVTLLTAGQTSLFTIGQRALLTGGDLQGGGYPPNPWNHDWVLITAKDGGCQGTGTVCFQSPILNPYKSTWPCYPGCVTDQWVGGPATLYAIDPGWNGSVEWRGLTFMHKDSGGVDRLISCAGRACRFTDVTFTGTGNACAFPSQNILFTFQNVTGAGCGIEADKIVDTFLVQGSVLDQIDFASASSITQLIYNTTPMSHLACTPLTSVLAFSTIGFLQKGGCGFGPALWTVLNGMSWTTLQDVNVVQTNVDSAFTMSGGIMSQALSTPPAWAVPGGSYLFSDGVHSDVPVTVVDIAVSGGNLQIITDRSGGYPFTPLNIKSIPVPTNP